MVSYGFSLPVHLNEQLTIIQLTLGPGDRFTHFAANIAGKLPHKCDWHIDSTGDGNFRADRSAARFCVQNQLKFGANPAHAPFPLLHSWH
jgi:hypothetical protein